MMFVATFYIMQHASPLSIFSLGGKAISLLVCVCSFASSLLSFHVPTASLAHEVTLMSLWI